MGRPLHVLIVEDSADDAELILRELRRGGFELVHARTASRAGMEAALETQLWDIVISDHAMPAFDGFAALSLVRQMDVDLPFILVSGTIGEDTAVAAMKAGAHDYLMKGNLARLVPAVERELRDAETRRERKKAEAELEAWHWELESRVKERTAELALAHERLQAEIDERQRLEAEIVCAIEREQLRLGQELFDGLGQQLRGIGFLLSGLQTKLKKISPTRARDATRLETMVVQCVEHARKLARGFYPVELEPNGLLFALEELARSTEQSSDVICVVQADASAYAELKGQLAIQLFRIAQEGAHNAVKHAKAKQILILLATQGGDLLLTVKDDGIGLPQGVERATGMGLRIMRYRARMIGGNLDVRNDPTRGVIISCRVPGERKPPVQHPARTTASDQHRSALSA